MSNNHLYLVVFSANSRLLSSIKPGLVKKINRLPTPIAGLVGHWPCFTIYNWSLKDLNFELLYVTLCPPLLSHAYFPIFFVIFPESTFIHHVPLLYHKGCIVWLPHTWVCNWRFGHFDLWSFPRQKVEPKVNKSPVIFHGDISYFCLWKAEM